MSEDLKNFALDLKAQREKTNLSLQNIFQRTRIDVKFLTAIEEGNFDVIESVYLRAFIKGYANALGLDPDATLKNYDLASEGRLYSLEKEQVKEKIEISNTPKNKVFASEAESDKDFQNKESRQQKYIAPVSIIIFIICAVAVYFFFIQGDSDTIIKETPFNEILEEKESQSVEEHKPELKRFEVLTEDSIKAVPDSIPGGKAKLKILAIDTTWIRITIDDQNEEEYLLVPGNTKNYNTLNNFKLLVGNAAGINIYLNDSLVTLEGKKGEIKYLEISDEGLTYLKVQKINTDAQQN